MKMANMKMSRKNVIILVVVVLAVAVGILAMGKKKQAAPVVETFARYGQQQPYYPVRGPQNARERALVNHVKSVVVRLLRQTAQSSAGSMTMTVAGWRKQGSVKILVKEPSEGIIGWQGTTLVINPRHPIVKSKPKLHMGIIANLAYLEGEGGGTGYTDPNRILGAFMDYYAAAKKLRLPLQATPEFRDPSSGSTSAKSNW